MKQRGTLTCVLVAASVFTALLVAWRGLMPLMTPASQHPSQLESTTIWIAPEKLPFTAIGEIDRARTVVIGDSRVMNGMRRDVLDDAGFGPTCVLWSGGADLLEALNLIDQTEVDTLVAALSPLSVSPFANRIMKELVRRKAPVFEPGEHTSAEIYEWIQDEKKHLAAKEFSEAAVDSLIKMLHTGYLKESAAMTLSGRIDAKLDRALADFRFDLCRPVRTGRWNRSWLPLQDTGRSNAVYRRQLSNERYRDSFDLNAGAITNRLRELSRDMDVVVVRLPVSPELRAVEDEAVPPDRLVKIASDADVPFIDFGTSHQTVDGSHLNVVGSEAWSRQLAAGLAEKLAKRKR